MSNRAALRTNVHEDGSRTFDVLLSDGPDGDNVIELNCLGEPAAEQLLQVLEANGVARQPDFVDRYDA